MLPVGLFKENSKSQEKRKRFSVGKVAQWDLQEFHVRQEDGNPDVEQKVKVGPAQSLLLPVPDSGPCGLVALVALVALVRQPAAPGTVRTPCSRP